MTFQVTQLSPLTLTIPRLLIAILFIAIFTMAVRLPADTDTWWHLRPGQYIIENLWFCRILWLRDLWLTFIARIGRIYGFRA